ncbi:hypothetical protein [Paenibacillus humicola]|uniref:hypothetical protein n=1 Tax=Paenibacillus humicola TaxID=3110540 RepID=UPI00237B6E96|nr:hypothetical protein [Paenibacillus humicola]
MKRTASQTVARAAAIFLLSVVIVGCQSETGGGKAADSYAAETGQAGTGADVPGSPQQAYHTSPKENGEIPVVTVSESEKPGPEGAKMDASPGTGPNTGDPAGRWDPKAPALSGISLGGLQAAALDKLGKPKDSYPLSSGGETISVREFDGFSIGTAGGKVIFVEVYGKQADPGLNGLRIGDRADAAAKALGKPDTNTGSVMTYKAGHALLKLDVDPKTERIVSIKLFSTADQP